MSHVTVTNSPVSDLDKLRDLSQIRTYFESGVTRDYAFRRQQLLTLRAAILQHEEEIAKALHADLGKSMEESYATETGLLLAEINFAIKNLRSWMRPRKVRTNLVNLPSSSLIYREPLGVVLIIAPWNYPFQLTLIPLVGAIAAGNAAVLKPSELAPHTAALIRKLIAGIFPPQYVQVIQGEGRAIVPALIDAFRFDHIFYTGSVAVGRSIYQQAASQLVPVTLELGGKSPAIVEEDADLTVAAKRVVLGKFVNAGQTCVAPDYVLVHERVRDSFIAAMQVALRNFFGTDPATSDSYGRIIGQGRFDKLVGFLNQGRIIYGGTFEKASRYFAPTVMDNVSLDSPLMREEIFGPILPVFGYEDKAAALAIVRAHPNPLAFYIFTSRKEIAADWIESVSFGNGCVNNANWQFTNLHFPFGGIGQSGMGAYHGKFSFELFSHAKPVLSTPVWFDPAVKYPPFRGKLKWFKFFIK